MIAEDFDTHLKSATMALEAFHDTPCMSTASTAEWKLSILKIMLGPTTFDTLPAFARALREVKEWIDKREEGDEQRWQKLREIDEKKCAS